MRRVVLALMMLAVMLPAAAFARTDYFCKVDRKVRSACCCPTKAEKRERDTAPISAIRAACCCDVSTVNPAKTPATDAPRTTIAPPTVVVAIAPPPVLPVVRTTYAAIESRANAPPLPSGSVIARTCARLL